MEGSDHDPFADTNGVPTRREGLMGLRRVIADHLGAAPGRCPACHGTPATEDPPPASS